MSKFIILKFFLIGSLDQEAHVPQQMRANIRNISYSPLITSKYNQWSSKESRANDNGANSTVNKVSAASKHALLSTTYVVQNTSVDKL